MRNIWIIAEKEFKHFFISPVAYVISFAILLILGVLFYASVVAGISQQFAPTIQVIVGPLVTLLLFTVPAISMRSLAEEAKNGTLETILTAPVRDWELVVGKWLGGVFFILVLLLATWFFAVILNQIVTPGIDQGLMATNYLGLLLLSMAFLAVGVLISSFFSNQIAAFFAALGVLLILWMISYPSQAMGAGGDNLLRYLDLSEHFYANFYRGVVDIKDIVYYLSVTTVALFLGSVSIETRRWR